MLYGLSFFIEFNVINVIVSFLLQISDYQATLLDKANKRLRTSIYKLHSQSSQCQKHPTQEK